MSLRARLTIVYAVVFLIAGSGLLAVSYGLLAARLPKSSTAAKDLSNARLGGLCKLKTQSSDKAQLEQCAHHLLTAAQIGSQTHWMR